MDLKINVKEKLLGIPQEISYTLLLFVSTRILLTVIGVISRIAYGGVKVYGISQYIQLGILGIWSQGWDSGWYYLIAKNGYSTQLNVYNQGNYAFFPLYPLLMRLLEYITGNYYIAGMVISNIALIIAGIYLFKLVSLDSDNEVALNSIKYLFLFPTAFIFSAVLTESLFLALSIICFYYAKKENWIFTGVSGLFLALTRSIGIVIVIPLLYMYLRSRNFKLRNIKADVLALALIPFATFAFFAYLYYLTGDFLAYFHIERTGWNQYFANPFTVLSTNALSGNVYSLFDVIFILVFLVILILLYNKIDFSYWIFGVLATLIPLCDWSVLSMPRYLLVVFPLYIIFAKLSTNRRFDAYVPILLALTQGFLMVLWVNQSILIV